VSGSKIEMLKEEEKRMKRERRKQIIVFVPKN